MGRNAAFGRPGAGHRLRSWWSTTSHDVRANTVLGVVVAVVVAGLLFAAVSRDGSKPATGLAALAQLGSAPTSIFVPTTSTPPTTVAGPTSSSSPAAALPTTTTVTTVTTATTAPARSTGTPAATTTTAAPATPTTRANPDVIFSDPPPVTPTSQLTSPPPTVPPSPSTTTPPTTARPATTTTTPGALPPLPIDLPLLSTPR